MGLGKESIIMNVSALISHHSLLFHKTYTSLIIYSYSSVPITCIRYHSNHIYNGSLLSQVSHIFQFPMLPVSAPFSHINIV